MNQSCTITRRLASNDIDEYGNEQPATQLIETTCSLQQNRRDEPGTEGETSSTDWVAFFPIGTPLSTADLVSVDGAAYEVVGDPWQARQGSPSVWHVEASVRRVVGADDEVGS